MWALRYFAERYFTRSYWASSGMTSPQAPPASQGTIGGWRFLVDWTATGLFNGAYDDITDYVRAASWQYGRDYASQALGKSSAGRCEIRLMNRDGRYASYNVASPIYGSILPGRKVQIQTVGTDFAEHAHPSGVINGVNDTFTLPHTPVAGSVVVYLNNLYQVPTTDYTISGAVIAFVAPPDPGDIISAFYRRVTASGYADNEVPSGAINGVNDTFTLAATPVADSQRVFLNQLFQIPTVDYTISGDTITFTTPPQVGDDLRACYRTGAAATHVDNETPSGSVDGVNKAFSLAASPIPGTVCIYQNNTFRIPVTDYSVSGYEIVFTIAPDPGDSILVFYRTTGDSNSVQWTGYLEHIQPEPRHAGLHEATLRGVGPLSRIRDRKVSVPIQTGIKTGAAFSVVLDEIGWDANERLIDDGKTVMNFWWTGGKVNAMNALRELEADEYGFLRETKDGKLAFEDRTHRIIGQHAASQATLSDAEGAALGYQTIYQQDRLEDIYNVVEAEIQAYYESSLAVLWTLPETGETAPTIPDGASRSFWAEYPNPASGQDAVAVSAWTTPVASTDYLANSHPLGAGTDVTGSVAVSAAKFDKSMKITLTNNSGGTAYITLLQARGTPIFAYDRVTCRAEDSASKASFGERTYPIPAHFLPSTTLGDSYVAAVLAAQKDPAPIVSIEYLAGRSAAHQAEALVRDVSDRITIAADSRAGLGIDRDFWVEAIRHTLDNKYEHRVTYQCSPAPPGVAVWILGASVLGIDTVLADIW